MPSSYGVEASKVQAVTARTYAYYQMRENRFKEFGAHVDDSVISQVYNNFPENEVSIEAVLSTRGQILTYDGELILAKYFSTSGGTTANHGEVWAGSGNFPSHTPPFLRARAQFFIGDYTMHPGDLRTEEAAAAFFKNRNINGIDKEFPWFRWNVTMTAEELSERINASLGARQAATPMLIHLLDNDGNPTAYRVETIGTLGGIEVTRRGQGGNIMEIIIRGSLSSVRVQTEYNIRALLNPREIPVSRHDGSESRTVLSLLPSAFFTMEKNMSENQLESITFYGGGNGHGAGMSQNGVRALLDMGLPYLEILKHYYPGAELNFMRSR
jgi:stage II sporulation protein D